MYLTVYILQLSVSSLTRWPTNVATKFLGFQELEIHNKNTKCIKIWNDYNDYALVYMYNTCLKKNNKKKRLDVTAIEKWRSMSWIGL